MLRWEDQFSSDRRCTGSIAIASSIRRINCIALHLIIRLNYNVTMRRKKGKKNRQRKRRRDLTNLRCIRILQKKTKKNRRMPKRKAFLFFLNNLLYWMNYERCRKLSAQMPHTREPAREIYYNKVKSYSDALYWLLRPQFNLSKLIQRVSEISRR